MEKSSLNQWEARPDGTYWSSYPTQKQLPAGVYEIRYSQTQGYHLKSQKIATEHLLDLPMPDVQHILADIKKFWEQRNIYKANNLLYKRGILLYGAPGGGKSYILQQLIKNVIEQQNGIVISVPTAQSVEDYCAFVGDTLRKIEPERPMIVILEELDNILTHCYHNTQALLLSALDGLKTVDGGTVFLATTNFIERLPAALTNRPGRLDIKRRIQPPSDQCRLFFLENKLSEEERKKHDLNKWVEDTKGLSLAHLKELVVAVSIMGKNYDLTILNLKAMADRASSNDDATDKIGF